MHHLQTTFYPLMKKKSAQVHYGLMLRRQHTVWMASYPLQVVSFMMIRLTTKYRHGTIDLLDKDEANHLVREGHFGE